MIANFALTSLVIRKDDRWNRNVLRILKQGEQYQFNGYGDESVSYTHLTLPTILLV